MIADRQTDTHAHHNTQLHYRGRSNKRFRLDGDWYDVQYLTDVLSICDCVCALQFSDGTGLSSADLHSVILCLSTGRLSLMAAIVVCIILKPEVHNVSLRRQRRTEPRP